MHHRRGCTGLLTAVLTLLKSPIEVNFNMRLCATLAGGPVVGVELLWEKSQSGEGSGTYVGTGRRPLSS